MKTVVGAEKTITHYGCSECGWRSPVRATGAVEAVVRSRELAERAFDRHDCANYGPLPKERRVHERSPVNGQAELRSPSGNCSAQPLNIGRGGMLIRAEQPPPSQVDVTVLFTIAGQPGAVSVRGRIVDINRDMVRVRFLEHPADLDRILRLIEKERA